MPYAGLDMVAATKMPELTLVQLGFVRRHYGEDMTPREIARFLAVPESAIHHYAKQMGLILSIEPITKFCSPYPFQVARNVCKFNWETHGGTFPDEQT
jgi:hypothetical protein